MEDWNAEGAYKFTSDGSHDYMDGMAGLEEDFGDLDGLGDSNDSEQSDELNDWMEDLDLSIDLFGAPENNEFSPDEQSAVNSEADEMAAFSAMIEQSLANKHANQAAEEQRRRELAEQQRQARLEQERQARLEQARLEQQQVEQQKVVEDDTPQPSNMENTSYVPNDLSDIMRTAAYQQQVHDDEAELAEEVSDSGESMSKWFRILLSVLLIGLGAAGIVMLIMRSSGSHLMNSICFIEDSLCLITAVGINAVLISDRRKKVFVMKTAMWCLFLFYCLYAADVLFLNGLLEHGFAGGNFFGILKSGFSFNLVKDFSKMGAFGMIGCAVFVMPYSFCLPVLIKPCKNILVYIIVILLSVLAAGAVRIAAQAGGFSLAQLLMCLVGAAVAYLIFILPPLQGIMRSTGLLEWNKVTYTDEEND